MNVRSERGSGLLLAMIVVCVITAVAVGVIRFSAREVAGSFAGRHRDALAACAEAGRQLLLSRFRVVGLAPTSIQALNVTLDAGTGTQILGGHYASAPPAPTVNVQQIVTLPAGSMGPNPFSMQDRTGKIRGSGSDFGGTPYKVVVRCSEGTGLSNRQLEVEFSVRFGL